MKKFRILSLILAFVLTVSSIPFMVYAEDAANNATPQSTTDVKDEIPYIDGVSDYFGWGYSSKTVLTVGDADIPDEYQGEYVMAFSPKTGSKDISFVIDLRQSVCKGIKISDIESITFRVRAEYVESFRIRTKSGTSNQENQTNTTPGEWQDVVVTDIDGTFADDGEGYIAPFAFGYRNKSTATTVYFDGVTVELKEGVVPPTDGSGSEPDAPINPDPVVDTEAPVINWGEGIEVIRAAEGSIPLFNIIATDDVDGEISTVLTWSEGAFDESGRLSKGEHTLTITATDRAGNSSERSVFVFVNSDRPTVGHVVQDS